MKYFAYKDSWKLVIKLIFWNFIVTTIGFVAEITYLYVLSIILLIITIYLYLGCIHGVLTDDEIDEEYRRFSEEEKQEVKSFFNVSERELLSHIEMAESKSIGIDGCTLRAKFGKDHIRRSNMKCFTYYLFTKSRIMTYEVDYNIEEGIRSVPVTAEYFFSDVKSLESCSDGTFLLRTNSGSVSLPVNLEEVVLKFKEVARDA